MPSKELGRAEYRAVRNGSVVKVIASGVVPGMNVKVDIEQLPFLILPPMFALYFIRPDVVLPAVRPFVYEEDVVFPTTAESITINDADGRHRVAIEDGALAGESPAVPSPDDEGYCVFSWIGTDQLKVARCDALLPAVYRRVFGPDTFAECQGYVLKQQLDEADRTLGLWLDRLRELMPEASLDDRSVLMRQYNQIADRRSELKDAKIDLILSSQKMLDAQAKIERIIDDIDQETKKMGDVTAALARAAGVLKLVSGVVTLFAV